MRVLILTDDYPSATDYYLNEFIHERVTGYAKIDGWQVSVACLKDELDKPYDYVHEGIDVKVIRTDAVKELVDHDQPNIICIHFIRGSLVNQLIPYTILPIIVWVHGYEALGWYRRIFDLTLSTSFEFLKYIFRNSLQLWRLRKLIRISNRKGQISFVFISNWMKEITEADTLSQAKHFQIIPNPINMELFKYQEKSAEMRKKILIIRPFISKKYANDIAIKAILYLSSNPIFKELSFEIYGDGKDFDALVGPLYKFPNIKIYKRFVKHDCLPEVYSRHGIFLCPTRQDSQGVSMCEAMASGLVPLTSNNTAIPEFVEDQYAGFLTESYVEIAERIIHLYQNPELFLSMSINAVKTMQNLCDKRSIIERETAIIREMTALK